MNTLEDLYYGNLFPHEQASKLDDETKELLGLLNRNEEKLSATLSDEQKETFEKYKDCSREISEICERQSFITGFKLGAKIVIESMTWKEQQKAGDHLNVFSCFCVVKYSKFASQKTKINYFRISA